MLSIGCGDDGGGDSAGTGDATADTTADTTNGTTAGTTNSTSVGTTVTTTDGTTTSTGTGTTGTGETTTDTTGGAECPEGQCHPLGEDCADGELCVFAVTEFMCDTDDSNGQGNAGADCLGPNTCNPGLGCIQAAFFEDGTCEIACCSPHCDLNEPNTCPNDGEECIPWFEAGQGDACYANAGVCGVPM